MPTNDASRVGILDELIRQAGVPIDGISVADVNAVPPVVNVSYSVNATAEQIALGEQIKDGFDWRKRQPKERATVVIAMNQLTIAQRAIVDRAMIADFLRQNPRVAAAITAETGIPLVVDEVAP